MVSGIRQSHPTLQKVQLHFESSAPTLSLSATYPPRQSPAAWSTIVWPRTDPTTAVIRYLAWSLAAWLCPRAAHEARLKSTSDAARSTVSSHRPGFASLLELAANSSYRSRAYSFWCKGVLRLHLAAAFKLDSVSPASFKCSLGS